MANVRSPDFSDPTDQSAPPRRPAPAATVLEPNEARQGVTHHNVRVILGVSLTFVVIGMALAYFAFFGL